MARIPTADQRVIPVGQASGGMQQANLLQPVSRPQLNTTKVSAGHFYDARGDLAMAKTLGDIGGVVGNIATDLQNRRNKLAVNREIRAIDEFYVGIENEAQGMEEPVQEIYGEEKSKEYLEGLKENVIIGRLIPAGTGYKGKQERAEY